MALDTSMDEADRSTQVRVRLNTRHPDISIPDNLGPISVNTNFRRYALSTLVNTLRQSEKPIPFDFLIGGSFLRSSLDEYLTAHGLSAETILTVEYVRANIPPLFVANYEHEDWVSHVDVLSATSSLGAEAGAAQSVVRGQERVLSASYDGFVRVWNMSHQIIATSPTAHKMGCKAARFIDPTHIASGGIDRTIRICKFTDSAPEVTGSLQPQLELYGHRSIVEAIDVDPTSKRIVTAASDQCVGLWSTQVSEAPPAPASLLPSSNGQGQSSKRRKMGSATPTTQRGSLSMLKGHTGPVSDVKFMPNDNTVAYSGSRDHSLRTWDLTTSTCVEQRAISSSIFSLSALPTLNLVAAGTERHVTLIDPRANAASIVAMTLKGHKNLVSSLAPDPSSPYGLVSGSYDSTCRVWDVRSAKSEQDGRVGESTYVIERETAKGKGKRVAEEASKVFSVVWDRDLGILSAGEDKMVQINQSETSTGDATQAEP